MKLSIEFYWMFVQSHTVFNIITWLQHEHIIIQLANPKHPSLSNCLATLRFLFDFHPSHTKLDIIFCGSFIYSKIYIPELPPPKRKVLKAVHKSQQQEQPINTANNKSKQICNRKFNFGKNTTLSSLPDSTWVHLECNPKSLMPALECHKCALSSQLGRHKEVCWKCTSPWMPNTSSMPPWKGMFVSAESGWHGGVGRAGKGGMRADQSGGSGWPRPGGGGEVELASGTEAWS